VRRLSRDPRWISLHTFQSRTAHGGCMIFPRSWKSFYRSQPSLCCFIRLAAPTTASAMAIDLQCRLLADFVENSRALLCRSISRACVPDQAQHPVHRASEKRHLRSFSTQPAHHGSRPNVGLSLEHRALLTAGNLQIVADPDTSCRRTRPQLPAGSLLRASWASLLDASALKITLCYKRNRCARRWRTLL
jgi:hypothetical protein